eukprot:Rmarinus@m.11289
MTRKKQFAHSCIAPSLNISQTYPLLAASRACFFELEVDEIVPFTTDAAALSSAVNDALDVLKDAGVEIHVPSAGRKRSHRTRASSHWKGAKKARLENSSKAIARETDELRLKQREKQLVYGKSTEGYKRYLEKIPKTKRSKSDPKTPDKHQVCSKRSWDGQVRKWRRLLHDFDPEPKGTPCDEVVNTPTTPESTNHDDKDDALSESTSAVSSGSD